jgi:hypothetical protein
MTHRTGIWTGGACSRLPSQPSLQACSNVLGARSMDMLAELDSGLGAPEQLRERSFADVERVAVVQFEEPNNVCTACPHVTRTQNWAMTMANKSATPQRASKSIRPYQPMVPSLTISGGAISVSCQGDPAAQGAVLPDR